MRRRAWLAGAATVGLLASALVVAGAQAAPNAFPGCSSNRSGGEWRSYGADLSNSRSQPAERTIDVARAKQLKPRWIFSAYAHDDVGTFPNTPVAADGCIYAVTEIGGVYALNADTGRVVWTRKLEQAVGSSPLVHDGRVIISVNRGDSPYVTALDQRTGRTLWSQVMDKQGGSNTHSSPVPYKGMVFVGFDGFAAQGGTLICPLGRFTICNDREPTDRLKFRGGWVLLDQRTGKIRHKDYVMTAAEVKAGYSGGGVWSTAAIDEQTGMAYVGTGNPFSPNEHPHTNSILKIDVEPTHRTFGQIVGSMKGTNDQYVPGVTYKPACAIYTDAYTCEVADVDFGASPQLIVDAQGRKLVADVQKSGAFHAADRASMQRVWQTVVGGPPLLFLGSTGTASYDGTTIYVMGSAPGLMHALDPTTGQRRWSAPVADGIHISPTTSANGVVYQADTLGYLNIWDAATGEVLQHRSMSADLGQTLGYEITANGVVVAYNEVIVPSKGHLIAYR